MNPERRERFSPVSESNGTFTPDNNIRLTCSHPDPAAIRTFYTLSLPRIFLVLNSSSFFFFSFFQLPLSPRLHISAHQVVLCELKRHSLLHGARPWKILNPVGDSESLCYMTVFDFLKTFATFSLYRTTFSIYWIEKKLVMTDDMVKTSSTSSKEYSLWLISESESIQQFKPLSGSQCVLSFSPLAHRSLQPVLN